MMIMNYDLIENYMEKHNFLLCDKQKIRNFIEMQNRTRKGYHKIVNGYLTRENLYLINGYGYPEEYHRLFLGIQENFK